MSDEIKPVQCAGCYQYRPCQMHREVPICKRCWRRRRRIAAGADRLDNRSALARRLQRAISIGEEATRGAVQRHT